MTMNATEKKNIAKALLEAASALEAASDERPGGKVMPTVEAFLFMLTSRLTQYDMRLSMKDGNIYRLGLLFAALEKVRKDVLDVAKSQEPEALERLKQSLNTRFKTLKPVDRTIKDIDAFLATGKPPRFPLAVAPKGEVAASMDDEPLVPIKPIDKRITVTLDDGEPITLFDLIELNNSAGNNGLADEEIDDIRKLAVGATTIVGGGAGAAFEVKRVK